MITLIAAVFLEYLVMLYYTNTALICKRSRLWSNTVTTIGYFLYCLVCAVINLSTINLIGFIVINFLILIIGFKETVGESVLRIFMMTLSMMFGELIGVLLMSHNIAVSAVIELEIIEYVIVAALSKSLYFLFIIIFKRILLNVTDGYIPGEAKLFILMPICTCLFFIAFNKISMQIAPNDRMMFIALSIMFIVTNFAVYIVYDMLFDKNRMIRNLKEIEHKNEIDYLSYELLKEKYDELKIMAHDFNKYCGNIEGMLHDDQKEALSALQMLRSENNKFLLVEYTKNRTLNVLLSQKMEDCGKVGVEFQIYMQDTDISFISEMDIVAIFSNLIDNAIESAASSEEKKIFFDMHIINGAYIVIKIDNSADFEPKAVRGKLFTTKKDKDKHGIGIMSVKRALANYGGRLKWDYDRESKLFSAVAIIELPGNRPIL